MSADSSFKILLLAVYTVTEKMNMRHFLFHNPNNFLRYHIIQKWILWYLCFTIDLQDAAYSVVSNYYENKVSFTYYKNFKVK